MQSQVLGGATGGHPGDGMPWLAPETGQGIWGARSKRRTY